MNKVEVGQVYEQRFARSENSYVWWKVLCIGDSRVFIRCVHLHDSPSHYRVGFEMSDSLDDFAKYTPVCPAAVLCHERGWGVGDWVHHPRCPTTKTQIVNIEADGVTVTTQHCGPKMRAQRLDSELRKCDPPPPTKLLAKVDGWRASTDSIQVTLSFAAADATREALSGLYRRGGDYTITIEPCPTK